MEDELLEADARRLSGCLTVTATDVGMPSQRAYLLSLVPHPSLLLSSLSPVPQIYPFIHPMEPRIPRVALSATLL